MNLIFLFAKDGQPMLLPSNTCKFNQERKTCSYIAKNREVREKFGNTSEDFKSINEKLYKSMQGTRFSNYCIIEMKVKIKHINMNSKVCFLVSNTEEGVIKFVAFFIKDNSLDFINASGKVLGKDVIIGCGVSKSDTFLARQQDGEEKAMYQYVQKRNLLNNPIFELQMFTYPQGIDDVLCCKRVVEYVKLYVPALPIVQRDIAMLFCNIFDVQLIGPLKNDMDEETICQLKFFSQDGKLFYSRDATKSSIGKTMHLTSVNLENALGKDFGK